MLDRVIDEQYPDASNTTFTYNGPSTSSINDKNQTTITQRNVQNRVHLVTEPGSIVSEYLYNAVGDLRQIKDPAGNFITHTLDTRGRVTQSVDPSLGTWNYQYTVLDQLKQQTDAKSQITTLSYDKLGRVTQVVAPGLTSTFTYDTATKGKGQLAMMETSPGLNRRTHTYDTYGRPSTTTLRVDGISYPYTSSYDLDGRLYTVQYPSGFTARYEYTANQRYLQYVKNHTGGATLWTANARNAEGQYTQATQGNNVVVNRSFNTQTGRISTITAGPSNAVANYAYAFDTIGNLTSRIDGTQSLTETFQYDARNRMTQATIGGVTKAVSYNTVGNILSKTRLGATTANSYTYPVSGPGPGQQKPYAVSSITGTVNGVTNPTFNYDDNGNLTGGAGRTLTYTSFNKVASITQGAITVSYVYDAEHQRLRQTTGSNTIVYLNDPASGASSERHSIGGGTWQDSIFADGERISLRTQTTSPAVTSFQYFVHDHLGSVAVVTNQAGAVVQRLGYDAWGRRRQPNGTEDPSGAITAPTSRGYTDHEHIEDFDLIDMNALVYDPEVGRFMSADSIIPRMFSSQDLNRYSYVYNNPGSFTDPSGYCEATTCVRLILEVYSWLRVWGVFGKGESDGPPPHHGPGLASTIENLRGTDPLHDVSAGAPLGGGYTDMGGEKFTNGMNTEAFEYASSQSMSWIDKTHLILNGASIALDASVIGAVASWVPDVLDAGVSAYEGDWTGVGMSVGAVLPGAGTYANIAKGARVLENANIGAKIERQLAKRGWSRESVREAVERPLRTVPTRDTRHLPGGGRMDDPATAYYGNNGGYVVRNDRTGDIVQISDVADTYWRAPWD